MNTTGCLYSWLIEGKNVHVKMLNYNQEYIITAFPIYDNK